LPDSSARPGSGPGNALVPARLRQISSWSLWSQPPGLVAYAGLLVGTAVAAIFVGLIRTPFLRREVILWLLLASAATACVELSRRGDEPAGVAKDLLSTWTIPVMLLLPPVFALLTPLPFTLVKQLRGRPGLVHRRVVSAAAIGLADATGSVIFDRLAGEGPGFSIASGRPGGAVAAGLLAALVASIVNTLLIATAARLAMTGSRWRSFLGTRESAGLDVAESCAGLLVAMACSVTWLATWLALPLVLLLHRTQSHAQLRAAARLDPKTGLLNAGAWQEEAEREIVRANRDRRPLAVLLADLDNFKEVNDRHGHLVGDEMLRAVAEALASGLRSYDLLGRFGGEEFTIALPNADHVEAGQIAERLRQQVAAAALSVGDEVVHVTVSIGGAILGSEGTDLTDLLATADAALYHAKAAGRDQVVFTSP